MIFFSFGEYPGIFETIYKVWKDMACLPKCQEESEPTVEDSKPSPENVFHQYSTIKQLKDLTY